MTRTAVGGDEEEPERSNAGRSGVAVSGSIYGSVVQFVNTGSIERNPAPSEPDLATQRQNFFFDFLKQALKQAETTFRLSVFFMSGGALILLVGGCLALANAGNPDWSYLPVLTALSGLLITSCGGAFALHSHRARKHLTEQAERIHKNIQDDRTLEQATALIDRIEDDDLRDRLKSVTALRTLGLSPDPGTVTDRLLPGQGGTTGEIEPGGSTR
ncbi:TRADD-N-associated membrane domain-containing protein [Streptomyces pini]|uniref:Cyanobacterial TRADD-N associated 2 transmembrane domain-containing protein n=1 Tax=Streptomyces pini TaxID=1520580 RepID=A0A1I4EFP7_9ACTN|nr:hypothetical protein [Streptomyces pini]SFL04584.1 hypothetical protein SAMN05192584_11259 [Streptomyces pini]